MSIPIPTTLQEKLDGYTWKRNTLGMSAQHVFHLYHPVEPHKPSYYLKASPGLAGECARTIWLQPYLPVPDVHYLWKNTAVICSSPRPCLAKC